MLHSLTPPPSTLSQSFRKSLIACPGLNTSLCGRLYYPRIWLWDKFLPVQAPLLPMNLALVPSCVDGSTTHVFGFSNSLCRQLHFPCIWEHKRLQFLQVTVGNGKVRAGSGGIEFQLQNWVRGPHKAWRASYLTYVLYGLNNG